MIIPAHPSRWTRLEIAFWDMAIGIISAVRCILSNEDIRKHVPRYILDRFYLSLIWITLGLSVGFILGLTGQ